MRVSSPSQDSPSAALPCGAVLAPCSVVPSAPSLYADALLSLVGQLARGGTLIFLSKYPTFLNFSSLPGVFFVGASLLFSLQMFATEQKRDLFVAGGPAGVWLYRPQLLLRPHDERSVHHDWSSWQARKGLCGHCFECYWDTDLHCHDS